MRKHTLLSLPLLLAIGCGDVSNLEVGLSFPESDIEASTQQLAFVVREPTEVGSFCDALWGTIRPGIGEFSQLIDYPNRNDVLAAPLRDASYTVFVYSYTTRFTNLGCDPSVGCTGGGQCVNIGGGQRACAQDPSLAAPTAGGCTTGAVAEESNPIQVIMNPPP